MQPDRLLPYCLRISGSVVCTNPVDPRDPTTPTESDGRWSRQRPIGRLAPIPSPDTVFSTRFDHRGETLEGVSGRIFGLGKIGCYQPTSLSDYPDVPLSCPCCYAMSNHLGGTLTLRAANDRKVRTWSRCASIGRRYKPLHFSLFGGNPSSSTLLDSLLPRLAQMGIYTQASQRGASDSSDVACCGTAVVVSTTAFSPIRLATQAATYDRFSSTSTVIIPCTAP